MANLRVAMDAAFWDLSVSSPQTLGGTARSVPGEPAPLGLALASRAIRPQQLSFLGNAFPLGIIPSFAPSPQKTEVGSFSIQSLLLNAAFSNWWVGLAGQFRPRKLISSIKRELTAGDELELPAFKDVARHFVDKSLFAFGLFSQVALTDDTFLLFNLERHGEKKGRRSKATLFHRLPNHDVTLEAAWPELFVDMNGAYWDVPTSVSFDIASLVSDSGLRYRFGLHQNSGHPEALNSPSGNIPLTLMPGICAKAAISYEKSKDLWREKEQKSTGQSEIEEEPAWLSSYDIHLSEPHAAVSGIIGGTCAAWFGGNTNTKSEALSDGEIGHSVSVGSRRKKSLNADLFGSLCYTFQRGKFKDDFNDLTRIDARLDISSGAAFIGGASHLLSKVFRGKVNREVNPLASPRLNITLQQQVAGPIIFRVESRLSSPSRYLVPHVEDVMFGLSYSLRMLQSGKILAWFSPKRKEAMVELRLFEF